MNAEFKNADILRPMASTDLEMVLTWRNAPKIRKSMYTQHKISLSDHRRWWATVKNSHVRKYLIFEAPVMPMGLVNFTEINPVANTAEWGFYTSPNAPKGTGRRLGFCALDYAFQNLGLSTLFGEVLSSNAASIAFHKNLGFHEVAQIPAHKEIDGAAQDVYRFAIKASEWTLGRSKVLAKIKRGVRDDT